MDDDHTRDELARLRALVESQQARLSRLERPRRRLPRRFLPFALVALLIALMPLATVAADFAFLDLNPGSPHNDNIAAVKAAGITKGCDPPAYDHYCPNGTVTREEMASFLARTAGLGSNPPVANAKTAQTATLATSAANATNANTVGGLAPSGLIRVAAASARTITPLAGLTTVQTVTITTPGAGFVLVTGASTFLSTDAACGCETVVYLVDTAPGGTSSNSMGAYLGPGAGAAKVQTQTLTWAFPVSGMRTYSYAIQAAATGTGVVKYADAQLTALYVPFGYDGGATLAP